MDTTYGTSHVDRPEQIIISSAAGVIVDMCTQGKTEHYTCQAEHEDGRYALGN